MRLSRDVVRPFVALLVVVAAIGLVSNVAAYRAATTHPQVDTSGASGCQSVGVASDRDGDHDADGRAEACHPGDDDGSRQASGGEESREAGERNTGENGGARVVTTTGAS